ncbi:MAG: trypsin-like serine peptidase [Methyloceanibacter sp.]|uniref:trypsin-like serine peptidase n=1 Tax=Methyloceanibacter sp. TaxID=1965321 RepID=UPI003D6C8C6B
MRHCAHGIVCLSVFLITGISAFAEDPSSPSDGGTKVIEETGPPWGAIGQINVAGYRRRSECTGSLIAPNVVITAAHCVVDPWRKKPFPHHDIHFLAGVRGSDWLGHATAKCLHFPPGYDYEKPSLAQDVALITLADSLDKIAPLDLDQAGAGGAGASLVHAAYPAKRRYVLTAQFGCRLVKQAEHLWLTDCAAHPASSGGPVFVQTGAGLKLAAIMVGTGKAGSVAVPIGAWGGMIAGRTCP